MQIEQVHLHCSRLLCIFAACDYGTHTGCTRRSLRSGSGRACPAPGNTEDLEQRQARRDVDGTWRRSGRFGFRYGRTPGAVACGRPAVPSSGSAYGGRWPAARPGGLFDVQFACAPCGGRRRERHVRVVLPFPVYGYYPVESRGDSPCHEPAGNNASRLRDDRHSSAAAGGSGLRGRTGILGAHGLRSFELRSTV